MPKKPNSDEYRPEDNDDLFDDEDDDIIELSEEEAFLLDEDDESDAHPSSVVELGGDDDQADPTLTPPVLSDVSEESSMPWADVAEDDILEEEGVVLDAGPGDEGASSSAVDLGEDFGEDDPDLFDKPDQSKPDTGRGKGKKKKDTGIDTSDDLFADDDIEATVRKAKAKDTQLEHPPLPSDDDAVDLGEKVNVPREGGGSSSTRDPIAEDLESGVALDRPKEPAKTTDSYEELLLGEENLGDAEAGGSSAALDFDMVEEVSLGDTGDVSGIDLDMVSEEVKASSEEDLIEESTVVEEPGTDFLDDAEAEAVVEDGDLFDDEDVDAEATVEEDAADFFGDEAEVDPNATAEAHEALFDDEEDVLDDEAILDEDEVEIGEEALADSESGSMVETETWVEERDRGGVAVAPPPVVKPKYGRRWLGGTVLGLVLGGAACVGLWAFGIQPPSSLREAVGTQTTEAGGTGGGGNGGVGAQQPGGRPAMTEAQAVAQLRDGDLDQPIPDQVLQANNPAHQAARGQFLWLQYLKESSGKVLTDPVPPEVTQARQALEVASKGQDPTARAEAMFWLGHIHEMLNEPNLAREQYAKGKQQFPDEPRFEAALNRLDARQAALMGPNAMAPANPALSLWASLVLLQQPEPPQGGQPQEAGSLYWRAADQAKKGQFAEARQSLAEARKLHDARRFQRLRKSQNPTTDPAEEIFLNAAEELIKLREIQERLYRGGYLAMEKDPAKALDMVFTKLDEQTKLATVQAMKITTLEEGAKNYVTMLGDLQKKIEATEEMLAKEKMTVADQAKKITAKSTELKTAGENLTKANTMIESLKGEKSDLEGVIGKVKSELKEGNYLDDKAGNQEVIDQVARVIDVARTKDPEQRIKKGEEEIRGLQASLKERWAPEEMLGTWLPILAQRGRTEHIADALKDVERVTKAGSPSMLNRAQALTLSGLAQRNQGNYEEARKTLTQALAVDAPETGDWKSIASNALKEISDPDAYYLPKARNERDANQLSQALLTLEEALKVFSENRGELLALRSMIHLDLALDRAGDELTPAIAHVTEAQRDAQAAIAAKANGAGHFAAGRVAEELGRLDEAAKSYQAAAEAAADPAKRIEYRLAHARVLLMIRSEKTALGPRRARLPQWMQAAKSQELLVLLMVGLQPPAPLLEPDEETARDAAEEALRMANLDPRQRALALMLQGLHTKALKTYVESLKSRLNPQLYRELKGLVESHPRLQRPESMRAPEPLMADRHYSRGLQFYFDEEFELAEKELLDAIENYGKDARYYYFLGLARLKQGDRAAYEDFSKAAELEAEGYPFSDSVNTALERVQGRPRQIINSIRDRVR